MSTTTAATTEISSNPNSSCRLLDCLNSLPCHDQHVFRSQLDHIELLRLSACCRSLRSSIRNDRVLWHELYHRDFLSGAYYAKEMDFVLWCIRTDVNNPCTSDKRADLLENVDWYNTYRRRVSTENNWRYGRCKTTRIDMKADKGGSCHSTEAEDNSSDIIEENCSDETPNFTLEYLPHSNLRSGNNIVHSSTFFTSPNILLLDAGNEDEDDYVWGDHYIAVIPSAIKSDINSNVKILSRKYGGVITTFDVPVPYEVKAIKGKWVLLVNKSLGSFRNLRVSDIMVFDIDNSIMCPGSIDDTWHATCFYKTTNNTAIVYTARLVDDDDVGRIEWALYQFSSNNPVVQLRSGWFQVPEGIPEISIYLAHNPYDSYMIIELYSHPSYDPYIIHSVESSGQSHTPRNCSIMTDLHIPIPLLRTGCDYSILGPRPTKIWTDLSYNDDQVLQIPGTTFIRNLIGDLYIFTTYCDYMKRRLLVDINTKKVIRRLKAPARDEQLDDYAMVGTIRSLDEKRTLVIQEYGEL